MPHDVEDTADKKNKAFFPPIENSPVEEGHIRS